MSGMSGSGRILLMAMMVGAACGDAAGTPEEVCPSAQVPLCAKADSTIAVISPMTNDAVVRSAAALGNPAAKAALTTEINAMKAAIAAGNVTQARGALTRARAAIAAARQQNSHPGDAPDLSAIELAILQLELATK